MNRYALFVDAGYFFAAGAELAFQERVARSDIRIRAIRECIQSLQDAAGLMCPGHELLRVYWYDAPPRSGLSVEQNTLGLNPGVKLRLGALNNAGEQKGVDSLIVTDLIELARNGAISDAVLLSGDEDIRIGVQVAQSFGLRVHLLGIGDVTRNASLALRMEADSVRSLESDWCSRVFERLSENRIIPARAETQIRSIDVEVAEGIDLAMASKEVAEELLGQQAREERELLLRDIRSNSGSIPPEFDRKLIAATARKMGNIELSIEQKREIRKYFVSAIIPN